MKTQFHPHSTVKCLLHKTFPDWAKTQFDPIKTQLQPNSVMPRHRTLWLVTQRIRRVPQPIYRQFADGFSEFTDSVDFGFRESFANLPIIDRRNPRIDRSGCRTRGVESSRNRQIGSPVDRPSGPRNHQLIVNRFHVIMNSAAWNLSPIHHQNAGIYHRADRPPAIRLLESSDNHPTKWRNHPTDSANRPIIDRRILGIYRSSVATNRARNGSNIESCCQFFYGGL